MTLSSRATNSNVRSIARASFAGCVGSDRGHLADDRRLVVPTPLVFRLDLGKARALAKLQVTGWPSENTLQCVQVAPFAPIVDLGPCPIDAAMVRMARFIPVESQFLTPGP